jgi:hypothetical protein
MSCPPRFDLCVTRGSIARHTAILRQGYDEVIETPSLYRGRLVFRDIQDDSLPEIFAITVVPEVMEDPEASGVKYALMEFVVAGALTALLPDYDIAAFVELQEVGADNDRLYNLKVRMGD